MKKIIESDLISIAHRILKLKDKSDISTLLKETELLHNKLILLQFYEDNKFRLDPSITEEKLFEVANKSIEKVEDSVSVASEEPNYMSADIVNDLLEDTKNNDIIAFEEDIETPVETSNTTFEVNGNDDTLETDDEITTETLTTNDDVLDIEEEIEDVTEVIEFTPSIEETQKTVAEIDEEIAEIESHNPIEDAKEAVERVALEIDPVFSVAHTELFENNPIKNEAEEVLNEKATQHFVSNQAEVPSNQTYRQAPLNKSINDAFAHKISIGLNDRIAFEKNLFNGNSDDLNRVISQLNTIESYQEAKDFIDDLVKPEFNNWHGKEDYENRFMELVEKRFL